MSAILEPLDRNENGAAVWSREKNGYGTATYWGRRPNGSIGRCSSGVPTKYGNKPTTTAIPEQFSFILESFDVVGAFIACDEEYGDHLMRSSAGVLSGLLSLICVSISCGVYVQDASYEDRAAIFALFVM